MNIDDVRPVLIVGAGTMGQQIGLQCAMHGYEVVLHDVQPSALRARMQGIRSTADQIVAARLMDGSERDRALPLIGTARIMRPRPKRPT
ncbi:MAG TPA: 3-hydroxyacyl-CoA dehydrogenase NAD-binding domain-containing protein [Actinomycetota bacterium]|jgi:3-hydroxybutyryl-CoA dehydrogenase|nr:3-hydroxyacyl-CoA dehydrogenase NAD-binding domain-containing protein [Actinomycetota bacterium]